MTGTQLPPPDAEDLINALVEAIDVLVAYRCRRRQFQCSAPIKLVMIGDLLATDTSVLRARGVASDPVGTGMKKVIHEIAQLLFDEVGMPNLESIADRIIKRKKARRQMTASIIDKSFDGVGRGEDRWTA